MKEGALSLVVDFPSQWPPPKEIIIIKESLKNTEAILTVDPKGRLRFEVSSKAFISQPIEFTNAHRALLFINWNMNKDPAISIHINSIDLNDSSTTSPIQVESKERLAEETLSFEHPDATYACSEWINWRKNRYSTPKLNPKNDREIKPIDSQVEELVDSIQSLEHFVAAFSEKPNLFVVNTLPHLRALLFWPDGKAKNYNPLLFRISGYIGVALPVFAFKDRIKETIGHELYRDAIVHRVINPPVIKKEYPNQKLMDFQEWLNMEVISDKTSGEHKVYKWKDVIFDAANTISASHYDDDIPKFIKNLQEATSWDTRLFLHYISAVAFATITLGNFILNEYRKNA